MSSYWADRFISEEERRDRDNRRYYSTIEKEYNKVLAGLEKDIEYWLGRIAKNNDISFSGAKELLSKKELQEFKWTVEEYIKKGEENRVSGQWLKQLENASARVHIQRLEALKIQIQDRIENMYTTRDRSMEDYLCRVYKDTYYHTVFEIDKGIGSIQSSFNKLDDRKVSQIIHKPWAIDGKDFSTRIWEDKANLVNTLHTGLTQSLIRGGNLDDVVNDISQFVSSKIKNKKYVASRLVTTESAAYASKAQEQAYKDLSVDKYEILATLDLHTSDICQDLDGKIFDRKDYQVGVTAPPFHPNCRTVTVPWFLDDVDTGERVARGKDGKVGYVPQNMTYKEWYNKYVEQKFEENGIIELDSNSNNPVIRRCIEKQIEYIGIEKSSTIPLEEAIISELGGGDKTRGSCSSLAFAYIGNKNGYKVLDFRGGNSQAIFASNKTILEITELEGIKSWVVYEKNDFTAIKKLITNMEEKREYYLAIGRHAAIIRKIEKGYEYLELQSAKYNGFKTFDMNVLKNRFGCQKSYRRAGMTLAPPSMLIDIDTLKDNKEFNQMLGFINTAKEKQLKGVEGYEK
ncbi:minor capsid protein [uncultured Fusobacterium sp.]|uniref:minor capsid protein n=1 Tax=uncultured Fusobacterium sp. TaxID=159267 RepID=UPI002055E66A|nr:minor capsid protein [uncultured Fusobacterium sp.]DAV44370.1 MAG TPA: minor capsid protein [Caudoviricetes sp.]